MSGVLRPAVVFYARDFLSVEFARMGRSLADYARVYIVVSAAEKANVQATDPDGEIFELGSWQQAGSTTHESIGAAYNNDRYLRAYDAATIERIVARVESLCATVLSRYQVCFYLDEPVSGFPNLLFNRRFTAAGGICLHFQTSWIPGYMFFSSDPAHAVIPALNLVGGGEPRVRKHIQDRLGGGAVPFYVINYSSFRARVRDAGITLAKAFYRKFKRRNAYYLDSDPSAHFTHYRALLASMRGGYMSTQQLESLTGKYVVYPLHYEPEAILNYFSDYSRQEEIAEQILDALPLGYELILKEHPSQPGALNLPKWRTVTSNKRVHKVRGDVNSRALLRYEVAVVSIGSTLAIEAALAGKRVGVLGHVHFLGMPGIHALQSPRDLAKVLEAPPTTREQIESWYGSFLDRNCFEGNIMKGRTTNVDLGKILSHVRAAAPRQRTGEGDSS